MNVPGRNERDPAKIVQAIRELAEGAGNAVGSSDITLTPGVGHTVVRAPFCASGALVNWSPTSASAATATVWLQATTRGSFTLGHDVSDATDRTFRYEVRRP